ncbi:MAG: ABC transporter permease [bacterium]
MSSSQDSTGAARPASWFASTETITYFLLTWSNLIALALLVLGAAILSPYFLEPRNIFNVLRGASIIGIVSVAMTFVILNRGIDLSVGSIVGAASVATASFAPYGVGFAMLAALVIATFIGLVNGLIITKLRIQPFIATLASLIFVRGAVYLHTDGSNVIMRDVPEWFRVIGSGHLGPVPVPVLIFMAAWLGALYVLNNTRFGRHVYSVGANEHASRLYGINIDWVKIRVYALSGLLCGIAGIILTSRLTVAEPNAGELFELQAIAATLIGGTTFDGGVGGVGGTILGVLILAVLANIMNLMDVSPYYQMLLQGAIIVVAVVVSEARQRRQ